MNTEKRVSGQALGNLLPQKYPFVFVDRIDDYEAQKWITGVKNISAREAMLIADDDETWPHAYVIESLGQLAIALLNLAFPDTAPPEILLGRISGVEMIDDIPLGCQLDLSINVDAYVEGESFIVSGHADVAGQRKVTMGSLVAKIINPNEGQS